MPGHVFVVHSRMEGVQYDVAVVHTSPEFHVRHYWGKVLGITKLIDKTHLDVEHLRPEGWPRHGFARVPSQPGPGPAKPAWFLDVAARSPEALMANLEGALLDIAAAGVKADAGRLKPLVALSVIGVQGGGFGSIRGQVIDLMFQVCHTFVATRDIDLVITCADASDYAAFQHQRREHGAFPGLNAELKEHGMRLAQLAQRGDLALFLGAGVSMPAGLPSWWDLLVRLGRRCGVSPDELRSLESPLDQAELVRRRLSIQGTSLKAAVKEEFGGRDTPSLSHVQLAALGCREVVTTNFDSLYETAVNACLEDSKDWIKVLPFEQQKPFHRWILKMHGDLEHDGELILSRSDFVGYSAAHGPVGSIVQSLMLTKHLLVVGTSLTDDNFLRLAYEVTNYLRPLGSGSTKMEPLGTVLALRAEQPKRWLWEGTFNVIGASEVPDMLEEVWSDEEATAAGKSVADARARDLSVMLDFIAMHATQENYLLDERYAALLDSNESAAAQKASDLCSALGQLPQASDEHSGWHRLRDLLKELGADQKGSGARQGVHARDASRLHGSRRDGG